MQPHTTFQGSRSHLTADHWDKSPGRNLEHACNDVQCKIDAYPINESRWWFQNVSNRLYVQLFNHRNIETTEMGCWFPMRWIETTNEQIYQTISQQGSLGHQRSQKQKWHFHEMWNFPSILAAALPAAWHTAEELYVVLPGDKIPGPESNLPGQRWPDRLLVVVCFNRPVCRHLIILNY